MKLLLFKLCIPFFFISCTQYSAQSQKQSDTTTEQSEYNWIKDDLITKWEGNKKYTLNLLNAMPEEHYDFRPIAEMKTFKEQVHHISTWLNNHINKVNTLDIPKLKESSKVTIIQSYTEIFDAILGNLEQLNPSILENQTTMWYGQSSKLRILNLMDNHLAHHRGQIIVYLRLKGIKPPTYLGW